MDQEASDFGKVTEPSLSEVQAAQSNVQSVLIPDPVYLYIMCLSSVKYY